MIFGPEVRVLALAPHTDDVELGAGATIARMIGSGCQVHYYAFSDCKESVPKGFARYSGEQIGTPCGRATLANTDHIADTGIPTKIGTAIKVAAIAGAVFAGGQFVVGDGGTVWRSPDGLTWSAVNAAPAVPQLGLGRLLLGTRGNQLFRSEDAGFTWRLVYESAGGLGLGSAAMEGL